MGAGHACGHHLFGTASVAAGIELKKMIEAYGWKGTIKVFGTPAEEGGSGKVYMVRAGLFRDVDVASESAELTKRNILAQAGTAMLAQANSNNMLALVVNTF